MMIAVLLAATAAVAEPTAEAEALGVRLARVGTLSTIAPMLMRKETEELVADHPELTPPERDALRATARRVADEDVERLTVALGRSYAKALSLADLRALVAAGETPAAARFRTAMPAAVMGALSGVGRIDFKGGAVAAFCRETGKACPGK